MSSLLLALALSAWPVPRDAGAAAYADPVNWPAEPQWSEAWPLFSFTPSDWPLNAAEVDAGVGMRIDRAWSITRGRPDILLAVIAKRQDLSDPLVARAWRLNPGELPDAGDLNGNGRLDVGDFAGDPRVRDVNDNGALDLEDVITALADGVDQDGNGRTDDLCGWDLDRDAILGSAPDAGLEGWRRLAAPVGDDRAGIGVCPGCTLLPIVASGERLPDALRIAADAGARALLLPHSEAELSAPLQLTLTEIGRSVLLVTEGSGGLATFPLALHPAVISPRTLTTTPSRNTATSRAGCGGTALAGTISVPSSGCGSEAAEYLVGLAGLLLSVQPTLDPGQVVGLLGGERVDAERALLRAEGGVPAAIAPLEKLRPPAISSPVSAALSCAVVLSGGAAEEPVGCDGGQSWNVGQGHSLDPDPGSAFVRFIERQGPFEWSTALPSPAEASLRGLLGVNALGPGSGPPRYVDIDGLGSEAVLASSPVGLVAFTTQVETLTPALAAGRSAPAFGDVNGDRLLDVVITGDDNVLRVQPLGGDPGEGYPSALDAGFAGPPVLVSTFDGTALVTVDVLGHLTHAVGPTRWSFDLGAPQVSAPAAGLIDGDAYADLAIANGNELRVLITDARGPTPASWSAPSRATQALLGNLVGNSELEIVAERVFDARGAQILELANWNPPVGPPALARIDRTALRALLQLEARPDGRFELTRYDVERALRDGDSVAERRVLRTIAHPPARGGFAIADVTGDRNPDVLLPTEDGLLFIIDGEGESPFESPLPTLGTVLTSPAVGVARDQLEFAVRTTRGDLVRWLGRGLVEDISWESAGHDRANTWNAETPLPHRHLSALGVTNPPIPPAGPCGCAGQEGLALLGLVFLFRRQRRTC